MTEIRAIKQLVKAWGSFDFKAGDFSTIENAIVAARFHVKRNPKWTELKDTLSDIEAGYDIMCKEIKGKCMLKQENINQDGDVITSDILLNGAEFKEVKGAKGVMRKDGVLEVKTTYPNDISFNVWVIEDERLCSYNFVHYNKVEIEPHDNKPKNDMKRVKAPSDTKYPYVPKPALTELL